MQVGFTNMSPCSCWRVYFQCVTQRRITKRKKLRKCTLTAVTACAHAMYTRTYAQHASITARRGAMIAQRCPCTNARLSGSARAEIPPLRAHHLDTGRTKKCALNVTTRTNVLYTQSKSLQRDGRWHRTALSC